jgi:glycosyltransferase involved in cell wall biosynthesis
MELSHAASNTLGNGLQSPTVSVVIPALNEERNLPHVFAALPDGITEVILVDGGSVDRTVAVARELRPDVVVVRQTRKGKGNALACGLRGQHRRHHRDDRRGRLDRPARDPAVRRAAGRRRRLREGLALLARRAQPRHHPLRKLGNDGLNLVVNVLFGTRFTDLCYGYNAFWRSVVPASTCPTPACRSRPTAASCGATASRSRR